MAKKKWSQVVQEGLWMHQNKKKHVYLYGCKGDYLRSYAQIQSYIDAQPSYFSRYTAEEIAQIKRNSLNKYGWDCSGFTAKCTGGSGRSDTQYNSCTNKTAHLKDARAGSLLYTTYGGTGRHIGIDMGYGYVLDMAYESTDANIAAGKDSVRLYKREGGNIPWEWAGEYTKTVDYTGAEAY